MATYLFLLLALAPRALNAADVVVLSGGDRMTGTVQKVENGQLFFLSSHSSTPLQIDFKLVSKIESEPEGKAGKAAESAEEEEEKAPGFVRRAWENSSLSADFGQSYSGLAHYNQLTVNTDLEYQGTRWDGSFVTHSYFYGGTESAKSTYQTYARLTAQRYLGGDHLFLFPYLFAGRQTTADGGKGQIRQYGGGIGWTFRRQKSDQVSLSAGLVRSTSTGFGMESEQGRVDRRIHDILYVAGVSWEKTTKRKITTSLRLYYFKPVDAPGSHAMATDASTKIPIFGPAYLTLSAYDTPQLRQRQLFSTQNLQISSGIGVEF